MSEPPQPPIDGYRILDTLGRGGEGLVYLAESTDGLAKRVALKCFKPDARDKFEREREAYRRIEETRVETHTPHLVEGLAAGPLPDGGGFIALAYHQGGTLADRVKQDGPLSAHEASQILRQVLSGLSHLHDAGLCHRDIKPHNILVGSDGLARLGDFGLSRDRDGSISTGGTPAFAAPEQWSVEDSESDASDEVLARSGLRIDVYGTGATFYYLLTGRSPAPGAPDLFQLEARKVPRDLQQVLLRSLAAQPEGRYGDAREFSEALDVWSARLPMAHAPSLVTQLQAALERARERPPAQLAGLAAGMVLLVVVVVLSLTSSGAPATSPTPGAGPSSSPTVLASLPSSPVSPSPAQSTATPPATPIATEPEGTPISGPRLEVVLEEDTSRVVLVAPDGSRRELGTYSAGPVSGLALPQRGLAVVAAPPGEGDGSRLLVFDHEGDQRGQTLLPGAVAALLATPDERVAVGTSDGLVLLVDPSRPEDEPRQLAQFAKSVVDLRWVDGQLEAEGDDRQPVPLAEGEPAPPDALVIEGALGRYAYPRKPVIRSLRLTLPD